MSDGLIFLLSGTGLLLLVLFAEGLQRFRGWSAEATRKLVHVCTALYVVLSPWLFTQEVWIYVLGGTFVLLNAWALRKGLFRGMHGVERFSIGTVTFPLALILLLPFCWTWVPERIFALQLAFLVMGLSDPLASLVGQRWGRHPFRVSSAFKSVEGSIAFFLSALLLVFLGGKALESLGMIALSGVSWGLLSLIAAVVATLAEVVGVRGWDNLLVAVLLAAVLVFGYEHPQRLAALGEGVLLAVLVGLVAWRLHFLDVSGALAATLLGTFVFGVGGWPWALPVLAFFVLSSILSKLGKKRKAGIHMMVTRGSRRDMIQVWANGGIPLLYMLLAIFLPRPIWYWGYVGALAAATADTWATEIGTWVGGSTRHLITWKEVPPGVSGGLSLAGSVGGLLGAGVIGLTVWLPGYAGNGTSLLAVVGGGVTGMLVDSLLGATLQVRYRDPRTGRLTEHASSSAGDHERVGGLHWLNNDGVNVICTFVGALVTMGWMAWLST